MRVDALDVVAEGDDYGTQQSMLVSPATFRSLFKPRLAELLRAMKKRAPEAFVFLHSCGSVRKILPDFGQLDLSPMVVMIGLVVLEMLLIPPLRDLITRIF